MRTEVVVMLHRPTGRPLVGAIVLLLSFGAMARAQAPLVDGLGGAAGYGTRCMSPNDDGSSDPIDLSSVFPSGIRFYGTDAAHTHSRMFVNTNGNITFGEGLPEYSPHAFPVAAQPMIAPYWADVDIRRIKDDATTDQSARCIEPSYTGAPGNGACLNPTSNGVWWQLDAASGRVIVTWDDVNYFACQDDAKMSFQLILSRPTECASEGDFDVEFRYATCGWNTGWASGGGSNGLAGRRLCTGDETPGDGCAMPAQAGFDAGDEEHFTEIPGSRTNEIHTLLCSGSNVGMRGVYRYQIRSGRVVCPGAGGDCTVPNGVGACAAGVLSCVGSTTECAAIGEPSAELCDGIDNDCNGQADDGNPHCDAGTYCSRGRCVPVCQEGLCGEGLACVEGECVDFACSGIACDANEICVGGECRGACDGVVCPAEQTCRSGRCIDVCDETTCDASCSVCSDGACVARCDGAADCAPGETCLDDGRCMDSRCVGVDCGAGGRCDAGSCVDRCEGVICPSAQSCSMGECRGANEPIAPPTTGNPGGGDGDDVTNPNVSRGCGCSVGSRIDPSLGTILALGLIVVFVLARRRDPR